MHIVNILIPHISVDLKNNESIRNNFLILKKNYYFELKSAIKNSSLNFGINPSLSEELLEDLINKIIQTVILDFGQENNNCHLIIEEFTFQNKLDYSTNGKPMALNFN